jgi:hypothetical protein
MKGKGFLFIYSLPKSETREWIGLSGSRLHEKEEPGGERLALGFTSPLVFVASRAPAGVPFYNMEIIYFLIKKIWCINEKYFGRYIVLSKDFIS